MQVEVADENLRGFNQHAREVLADRVGTYASDVVAEVGRIEAGQNSGSNVPQVTSGMVSDADLIVRKGLSKPKKSITTICLRMGSAVGSLLIGLFYNSEKLQSSSYMLFFILGLAVTILLVTITIIRE